MKVLMLVLLVLGLGACASKPVPVAVTPVPVSAALVLPADDVNGSIDYFGLQKDLGLTRAHNQLGFQEKDFDTCQAGYGFSRTHNCHREFFVLIQFQLMCRDSEGTISTALSAADLTPLSTRSIKWNLKGTAGTLTTDGDGYGQIRTTVSNSQRNQRLKLTTGLEFLYLRAGETNRIVAPQPWCADPERQATTMNGNFDINFR